MDPQEVDEPKREPRSIQSIEIGFRLIAALERSKARLPLHALATRAGMSPSKAHFYLVSFAKLGLVVQDPQSRAYSLGPYAVHLGLAAMRGMDVLSSAREPTHLLQAKHGLCTFLSIWGNMGPTILLIAEGDADVPSTIRVGHVLPLLTSATARVFLELLSQRRIDQVVDALALDGDEASRVVSEARAEVGEAGRSRSYGRVIEGFASFSAPVLDHAGEVCAALTAIGPRSRLDAAVDRGLGLDLVETCASIGRDIGYRRDDAD